ncbi:MAG TPA: hypothetical protein PKA88_39460 [Polyangiaceae bacterium]|nr:hypothetical protein [Polyangiaceae bacterium]
MTPPAETADNTPLQQPIVGEQLLHPVVLSAVALLLLNDHVFKRLWPSAITGKLSDIAGLVFFPLFLQALWEMGLRVFGKPVRRSSRVLLAAVVLTALVFAAVQLHPAAAELYRVGLGALQWPFEAGFELLGGRPPRPAPRRVHLTQDVTDLLTLPALAVPLWLGRARAASP